MSSTGDAFRQKLFCAAGMTYTKPTLGTATMEGASSSDVLSRRMSRVEVLSGTNARRESVTAQPDGGIRRPSVAPQLSSPIIASSPTNTSRRSTVLADLDALSSLSLGPSNFFARQKAVKEALVQSIIRRKERNQGGGNSLFLFASNRNQVSTVCSTSDTLQNDEVSSTDELGECISDLIKLGMHVSSSWLEDELKLSPTAKKRFQIFRNPTPDFPDDPTTPQPGRLTHSAVTNDVSDDSTSLPANGDSSDIKLFNSPFSATEFLRNQGISVDGSQTMLQKIIWNHDECLLNLQHLSLSDRDLNTLSAWLLNLPPATRLFLKFRNCGLTDRSFAMLFHALSQKASLIHALDLSDNKLTSRSTGKILTLLETCKKCQQWELCGLHLQDSFSETFAKSDVQEAVYFLSKLDLSNNSFGNFGMCSMVPIISSFPCLEYLDLSSARITSKAASRISSCFSDFSHLSHLGLNNCCLSDEDANVIVCGSIRCKTLTVLNLRDNQIVLMPIFSLCSHLCNTAELNRTSLTVVDFSSNPLDFMVYERLMDMKEERLTKSDPESPRIRCDDCNWSHNLFSTLSKDVNSIAYGNGRNFNVNCKTTDIECDSSKHVWQCFLMVLQWRQCHSMLSICQSDVKFPSKTGLFEVFSVPKDIAFQISCRELGFWEIVGHQNANSETSTPVESWIKGILRSISLQEFGVPEAVMLPVMKNLIFRYNFFMKTENVKQLLAFSGSHDGRLGVLLLAIAKHISSPFFKDIVFSLPKSIAAIACQKFCAVLIHSGNCYSGRSYVCFEQHLDRSSFERLYSLNRSVRIQRINDLSLDLSDDRSVNIVRAVQDESGVSVDFEKFVNSDGSTQSTKSFVTFDLSLPTCAEGNVSDEYETAATILQLKNWAQSVSLLGNDAISTKTFSSSTNCIELYDIAGALEMLVVARCRNYRCDQIALMMQALEQGLIHRIPEDQPMSHSSELWSRHQVIKALFQIKCGGFRASFLHLMWDSIIDKESVSTLVAPHLKPWEWHGVMKRVGCLLLFNPMNAHGSWMLNLDKRDDRMVADMIIQLKIKEKGHISGVSPRRDGSSLQSCDTIDGKAFDVRSISSSELLPVSGALIIHLQCIDPKDCDLELRHKLAQKCAVKEWFDTDVWFREMLAKRK